METPSGATAAIGVEEHLGSAARLPAVMSLTPTTLGVPQCPHLWNEDENENVPALSRSLKTPQGLCYGSVLTPGTQQLEALSIALTDHSSGGMNSKKQCPGRSQLGEKAGGGRRVQQLLVRWRQENRLSPGGGGCSELRSCYCTPAWARVISGMEELLEVVQEEDPQVAREAVMVEQVEEE
ncbi:hypothetical protein AAY473_001932, partial [Plecturocebus cupreus]